MSGTVLQQTIDLVAPTRNGDRNGAGGIGDTIQGNQVSNGSIPNGSYGIFVFVPYANVSVSGNTVTNVDVGLGAFGGQGGTTTFTGLVG